MSTRPALTIAACALLVALQLSSGLLSSFADCPPCYRNFPSMIGRGTSSTGRRFAHIKFASSWAGDSGYNHIRTALESATNQWNTTGGAEVWHRSPYFLSHEQEQADNNVDIIIRRGALRSQSHCADTEIKKDQNGNIVGPIIITIPDEARGWDLTNLIAILAHELGHAQGLGHPNEDPACRTSTIMQGAKNKCPVMQTFAVRANDVESTKKHYSTPLLCTAEYKEPRMRAEVLPTPTATPSPHCVDNDSDGVCADRDCNDNRLWASFDHDGDGFCEDVDCNDTDPSIYPGAPIDIETTGGEDRNCNGVDDEYEVTTRLNRACQQRCQAVGADCDSGGNCYTPILLDVAGDGFRLTDAQGGVSFDVDNDGATPNRISWTEAGSDDAWLVLDRNGNGRIDGGAELFGDHTPQPANSDPNGFTALAEYDKTEYGGNRDGVINAQDAIFAHLRLWQDANHNGVSEPAELRPLTELGIVRLHLDYKESKRRDRYGNLFRFRAKAEDARGARFGRWAWDVFLVPVR